MNAFRAALLILLAALPCMAIAAGALFAVPEADRGRTDLATLIFPESLDIEMVDGIVYPGFKKLFRRGDTAMRILPGQREIALRYNMLFESGSSDHDIVKSKVMVLGFFAEPGETLRATHEKFRNAETARAGVQNFVVKIEDEQGVNRVLEASQISKNWQGEETITTRRDLASATAVAAVPGTLDVLKYAWGNATATERAAFLAWIGEHP